MTFDWGAGWVGGLAGCVCCVVIVSCLGICQSSRARVTSSSAST